jgi:hypothetical protein
VRQHSIAAAASHNRSFPLAVVNEHGDINIAVMLLHPMRSAAKEIQGGYFARFLK